MTTTDPCTSSSIHSHLSFNYPTACAYVQDNCADQISTINFFNFYYCNLNESLYYFIPFSLFFLLLMFYSISCIAERYLEPALSKLAQTFKFSESLAGVTLVALANGAPDVISAYAAGANSKDGILVPLGALFGAGIFTVCIVLCVCILVSPNRVIQAQKEALTRDCLFYFLGAGYFMAFGFLGQIYGYTAPGLLGVYAVFIGVVVWSEVKFRREMRQKRLQEAEESMKKASFLLSYRHDNETIQDYASPKLGSEVSDKGSLPLILNDELSQSQPSSLVNSNIGIKRYNAHSSYSKLLFEYNTLKHKIRRETHEMLKKKLFWRICSFLVIPLRFVWNMTIPASTDEQWSKPIAIIHPFTVSAFLIWQFGFLEDITTNYIALGIWIALCLIFSLTTWKLTLKKKVPKGFGGLVLVAVGFVSAAAWINLIANIIVDYVTLMSVFTGLPLNYIGLTLLAWGNSVPDFFVDTTLARKGLGQAAISGVFAGQYFNLSIGFGMSLIRQVILFGDREFDLLVLSNTEIISILLIGVLMVNLMVVMIYGYKQNYCLRKGLAVYLIVSYVVFFSAVTVLSCI